MSIHFSLNARLGFTNKVKIAVHVSALYRKTMDRLSFVKSENDGLNKWMMMIKCINCLKHAGSHFHLKWVGNLEYVDRFDSIQTKKSHLSIQASLKRDSLKTHG